MHERFSPAPFKRERALLVTLSQRLGDARAALRDGKGDAAARLERIARDVERAGEALDDTSAGSLYDRDALKAALAAADASP